MIKKNLFVLMAFFAALTVFGKNCSIANSIEQKKLPAGTWIIDTTIVKQTIDSVSTTTKIYLAGDTAVTFVQRPSKITVTADGIDFEYATGTQSGTYTVEGNKLFVEFPTHLVEYQFELSESGKLLLYYTAKYTIITDETHQAEEQCTFKGRIISETEN
jgi:hypothetical protein